MEQVENIGEQGQGLEASQVTTSLGPGGEQPILESL